MLPLAALMLSATLSASQIQSIESTVRGRMTQAQIPSLVVRVDVNGKEAYARAFGQSNLTYRVAANIDTRYQYGSITKQFTGASILALEDEGKLSIDDRIGKWLPEFSKFPVTIRQVLLHSGAIPDFANELWYVTKYYTNPFAGTEDLLKWSASQPLEFTPGEKAVYDNAGYAILARIVEKASGEPYFTFLS